MKNGKKYHFTSPSDINLSDTPRVKSLNNKGWRYDKGIIRPTKNGQIHNRKLVHHLECLFRPQTDGKYTVN